MISEKRDEYLSEFPKMAWDFHRNLAVKLSNPDDKAVFQADLYKMIDPETSKAIISATHHSNHAMHAIGTLVNCLLIHFEKE